MLNFRIEKRLLLNTGKKIVGMDEAGRGPLAGPIAVGAVLLDFEFFNKIRKEDTWWKKINDSKKLLPKQRENIFEFLQKNTLFSVGMVSEKYIDRFGLTEAIKTAARKALKELGVKPEILLVDGNRKFLYLKKCSERFIINGDAKLFSIACASIVAKVTRDRYMIKTGKKWPVYLFHKHKGYGTKTHLDLIDKYGPCPLHRMSFAPLKNHGFRKSSSRLKRENADN